MSKNKKTKSVRKIKHLLKEIRGLADATVENLGRISDDPKDYRYKGAHKDLTDLHDALEDTWSLSCIIREGLW